MPDGFSAKAVDKQTDGRALSVSLVNTRKQAHQNKSILGADEQEKELLIFHLMLDFPSTIDITADKFKLCWACC